MIKITITKYNSINGDIVKEYVYHANTSVNSFEFNLEQNFADIDAILPSHSIWEIKDIENKYDYCIRIEEIDNELEPVNVIGAIRNIVEGKK